MMIYHLRHLVLLILTSLAWPAFALVLGNASGQVVIGQPLAIRIPLSGQDAAKIRSDCMRLLVDDTDIADPVIKSATVRLANGLIAIETRQAVTQPLVSFRLTVDCGTPVARNYQLLPLLAVTEARTSTVPSPAATPAPLPVREQPQRSPAPTTDETSFTVTKASTLRLISRQRHPNNSRARVNFIRRVAAANPDVFPSIEGASDLPLAAGQQIRLPANLATPESPPPPQTKAGNGPVKKNSKEPEGKGKLVISSGVSLDQTVDELGSDLTRLTMAMNEQILIQTSMVERIKTLEVEFAAAKQAAALQQAMNQSLSREVGDLREQQRRNSLVQLVLVILLGGLVVFNLLRWQQERKSRW